MRKPAATLNRSEVRTVRAALTYARLWEESFIDAVTPNGRKPKGADRVAVEKSRRLIRKMDALAIKLASPAPRGGDAGAATE